MRLFVGYAMKNSGTIFQPATWDQDKFGEPNDANLQKHVQDVFEPAAQGTVQAAKIYYLKGEEQVTVARYLRAE